MRNKGFNAPYFKSSVDKQKELFNVVNNVPHYFKDVIEQRNNSQSLILNAVFERLFAPPLPALTF